MASWSSALTEAPSEIGSSDTLPARWAVISFSIFIASGYDADIAPCIKRKVPVIWVNRHGEKLEGRKAPDATVKNFREAAAKLGAK